MSDEKQPSKKEGSEPKFRLSMEVTLPSTSEVITLKKLKAGRYYEAQKVYVAWIDKLQKIFEGSQTTLKKVMDTSGNVDPEKLKEQLEKNTSMNIAETLILADQAGGERIKLLAICLDKEESELIDEYYPEDIDALVDAATELNNFLENVKKSVAPKVGGAQKTV